MFVSARDKLTIRKGRHVMGSQTNLKSSTSEGKESKIERELAYPARQKVIDNNR